MIVFNNLFEILVLVITVAILFSIIVLVIYCNIPHYRIVKKENLANGDKLFYPQRRIFVSWSNMSVSNGLATFDNVCYRSYREAKEFISKYVWKTFDDSIR